MLEFDIIVEFGVIIKENTKNQTFSLSTPKMKGWRLLGKLASIKYQINAKKSRLKFGIMLKKCRLK